MNSALRILAKYKKTILKEIHLQLVQASKSSNQQRFSLANSREKFSLNDQGVGIAENHERSS